MGYCRSPTLTSLGMLRPEGTDDVDEGTVPPSGGETMGGYDEGLGIMGAIRRSVRARSADPRRALAFMTRTPEGRFLKPTAGTPRARMLSRRFGISPAKRGGAAAAAERQRQQMRAATARARLSRTDVSRPKRRGGFGGIAQRMRLRAKAAADRRRAADAERAASEAAQIAEAERLAREAVIGRPDPPPPTDQNGQSWTMLACRGGPPDRRPGWSCLGGQWRYRMPGGGFGPQVPPPMNGAPAPEIPTARPWWQERPRPGDADPAGRDTSGIPTPPGLPGGPSMRPPPSGRDTATEVVAAEPAAAGPDIAKLLPLAAAAAFMMFR